jgi:hypothetical protein
VSPNPFSKYYYDQTDGVDITTHEFVDHSTGEPKLYKGTDVEQDAQRMLENGYQIIGYSSFNAGNANERKAISQARKVRAAVVLIYSQYTNTVSGVRPLTLPDTQTSSTRLRGSAYGTGGYTSYSGNAYTTTHGTRTTYIPYSVRRSDYLATYWVKLKPPILGTHLQDLTPDIRRELGSNKGMIVQAVINDSPAFHADIIKGDVLRRIGVVDIYNYKTYRDALKIYQGEFVDVVIYRDGKENEKRIQLGVQR